jgi:type 2 lantibiotic biosynthesis protein LanM
MRERYWRLSPLEVDLHSGLSGILFFLAWLGKVTGEERYTTLAREALGTVRRRLDKEQALPRTLGAFGDSGVLYALTHLGALWDEPALWDEAEALLPRLSERVAKDEHLDIFSGAAGCLAVLLVLHRTRPSPRVLELAVRCGERLLETARPMERGHGWVTSLGPRPLTGLSHGTAGIAWALLSLAEATGQARFHAAAQLALEYERAHFQPEAGNWSDLRADVAEGRCMTAICHGAPGIGLARLLSLPYLGAEAERARAELQVAVATTLATGFGGNHSLCHGDSGNLEFLVLAEQVLGDVGLGRHRERLAATLLGSLEQSGPLCGVALGVETPGLLMGLAGIGYGLLRLAAPAQVPSLLALEAPFSTGGARSAAGSR